MPAIYATDVPNHSFRPAAKDDRGFLCIYRLLRPPFKPEGCQVSPIRMRPPGLVSRERTKWVTK